MELNTELDATPGEKVYKLLRQQGCRNGIFVFTRGHVSRGGCAHCLLLVRTWKCLKNTSLHYSITVGLLALSNTYFQMCITGDALLRKVKTNVVYTTLLPVM